MSNIVRAVVSIKGNRPLLWHWFGPDALPLTPGEKDGVPGNSPNEWKKTVLITSERQLYVEPSYIFSALRDGAKYTKKGRGSIQTMLAATLQVVEPRVLIDRFLPEEPIPTDPELPVYLDIRGVRNPSTKGRNVRYRIAAGPGWGARFTLLWDKTIISRTQMEAVAIDTGKLSGLGNGRAIGFGRFDVLRFEVCDD